MAYKQTSNPLSRKTSPLKKVNPYEKGLGNTITEEELDLTSGSTSVHEGEKPAPKLSSGDMSIEPGDKDYEAISRKSSSPLNAHDENKVAELTSKIEARAQELTGGDPQSRVDPYEDAQIKQWIAERTAEKAKHKE